MHDVLHHVTPCDPPCDPRWQELVVVMNVNFETSASAAGWKGLVRPSLPQRPRDRHWYRERHAACGVRRVWREALGEGPGGVWVARRAACGVQGVG